MAKHILVIDAVPHSRFAVVSALRKAGYEVSESGDQVEALSMILNTQEKGMPFDLLCADIRMPGMTGLELICELERRRVSIPIIAISNYVNRDLVTELVRNCCSDLLVRPFEPQELLQRAGEVLERYEKGFF
ncbi:MAG: response regulator [Nitrospirae bacterium]|nr:response regulator [Nitrospirota bacterium]MCL5237163.1 response regulator [Nitrospirota bacterium]